MIKMETLTSKIILIFITLLNEYEYVASEEYCIGKTFDAKCSDNELISMESAWYGRMRKGKCIKDDLGHIGCKADVLHLLDKSCSGRQTCAFQVPTEDMVDTDPCPLGLFTYAEASYKCLKVPQHQCSYGVTRVPAGHDVGHLAQLDSCDARWLLEAQPGQQMNLSLIDFGWSPRPEDQRNCRYNYGYVVDRANHINMTICGGGRRERYLIESKSHTLEIGLSDFARHGDTRFLLKYQAIGCADLDAPPKGWVRRERNDVTLGCDDTPQTWTMHCDGTKWVGTVGTCGAQDEPKDEKKPESIFGLDSNDVLLTIVAAAALVICCFIATVGIVCYKIHNIKRRREKRMNTMIRNDVSGAGKTGGAPMTMGPINTQNRLYFKDSGSDIIGWTPRYPNDLLPDLMTSHNNLPGGSTLRSYEEGIYEPLFDGSDQGSDAPDYNTPRRPASSAKYYVLDQEVVQRMLAANRGGPPAITDGRAATARRPPPPPTATITDTPNNNTQ